MYRLTGDFLNSQTLNEAQALRLLDERVRVVLVHTQQSGNVGSTCRAMKTMGLNQLVLVQPKELPTPEARWRAGHAQDVLANARVCDSLDEAVSDCVAVIGTSVRDRRVQLPLKSPREFSEDAVQLMQSGPVAVVFGREATGLTNNEMELCRYQIRIPANPEYNSLNVAMAVQLIAYELRMACLQPVALAEQAPLAEHHEVEGFFAHLEATILATGFLDPAQPSLLMPKFRRLFQRQALEKPDIRMLRGMLTAMNDALAGRR